MNAMPAQQIGAILRGIRRSAKNAGDAAQNHIDDGDLYSAAILNRAADTHDALAQQCEALLIATQADELIHPDSSPTATAMLKRARQLQQKSRHAAASAREKLHFRRR